MRLDIICNDGSPIGVTEKSISGEDGRLGVGGAELALLTLCKVWTDAGYDVRLYNSPTHPNASCFEQLPIDAFVPEDSRDAVIVFRSPNERLKDTTKGLKIWMSCDQRTVGDFRAFAPRVDKIVTISPYHSDYFAKMYGIVNTIPIDLPVRTWEYDLSVSKVPKRCIFNSMPDRGIKQLHAAWALIVRDVPDAHLVITSDWRLWNTWADVEAIRPHKMMFARQSNVTYLGAVKRAELVQHELEAQVHLYPCSYEELFCISTAETQVAGAIPITTDFGALRTTNMGHIVLGSPFTPEWNTEFTTKAVEMLSDQDKLRESAKMLQDKAIERFSPKRILEEWNQKVFS